MKFFQYITSITYILAKYKMFNLGSRRIERARIVPLLDSTPSAEGSPSKRSKKRPSVPSPEVYIYKEMISSDINIPLAKKPKKHNSPDIFAEEADNLVLASIVEQDEEKERNAKEEAKRAKEEAKRAKKEAKRAKKAARRAKDE